MSPVGSFLAFFGGAFLLAWYFFPLQRLESTRQVRRWFLITALASLTGAVVTFAVAAST